MGEQRFKLRCGREVELRQFAVRVSTLECLSGSAELIRSTVIKTIPNQIARRYGQTGIWLREPPPGPLPAYTLFLQLEGDPINAEADFSSVVVVWFADSLPENLQTCICAQAMALDWNRYARDGRF